MRPSTRFHGCRPPDRRSEPTTKTGVVAPPGIRQSANPITTGMASATPLIDKRAKALALVQQRRVLEALRAARHDPEIGGRMIDHRRHHATEAQIEAHLDGDQNDGEDDPDDGRNEAKPIMKQISGCKREDQWHVTGTRSLSVQCQFSLHARRTPRIVAFRRETGSAPPMAAAIAQLMIRVPPNTIAALPIANKPASSRAYCSQTTNT